MLTLLASYPKSGNTWLRALLTNYFSPDGGPAHINHLLGDSILNNRAIFDDEMGVDSALMTADEIDQQRPEFCRQLCRNVPDKTFVKVHDVYNFNRDGNPLFPSDAVEAVIYPVRNPLAVAVSFAHHSDFDFDKIIDEMANEDAFMGPTPKSSSRILKVEMKSWSTHVNSWLDQKKIPVHTVRYEDIHFDPHTSLSDILKFLGVEIDEAKLRTAVEASKFDRLKDQEAKSGFSERPSYSTSFFRSGKTDDWKHVLSKEQRQRLERDHDETMAALGYLK